MSNQNELSIADMADRHTRYMAFAFLFVAIQFLAGAAIHLMNPDMEKYLEIVQVICVVLTLLLLLPMISWKLRNLRGDMRNVYFSKDGYIAQALIYAKSNAFVITFVSIVFLEAIASSSKAEQSLSHLPAEFYLQVALAIMLGSISLLFLFKTWSEGEVVEEEGADA